VTITEVIAVLEAELDHQYPRTMRFLPRAFLFRARNGMTHSLHDHVEVHVAPSSTIYKRRAKRPNPKRNFCPLEFVANDVRRLQKIMVEQKLR
jgi:hypothetical protein